MKASLLFRIAAVLILLFALGHTLGFRNTDPSWGVDSTLASLKSTPFKAQGFSRTYYDFFVGFGLFVTVFLVLAAVLAWQLGSLPAPTLALMGGLAWALTLAFALTTFLSWRYFFATPLIFSAGIFLFLLLGTLLSRNST